MATFFYKEPPLPSSITPEKLAEYRTNSYETGNYLSEKLFPRYLEKPPHSVEYSAYLYTFSEGFMVVLCANGNHPFFMHLPTVDGTDLRRMRRLERLSLPLSQEVHRHIETFAKRVHVTHLDHSESVETWTLSGVPPFICIEGRWNQAPESHQMPIDWDAMIRSNILQKQDAFALQLIHPRWKHIPQNPVMRGMSYKLSQVGFELWVHEKNTNALGNAQQETQEQITHLQDMMTFIKRFEEASFTFHTTGETLPQGRGGINMQKLEAWGNLSQQIPFPMEVNSYEDIPTLVREFRIPRNRTPEKEGQLIDRFRTFFQNLPSELHFACDYPLYEQFTQAQQAFQAAGNSLVRTPEGYIETDTLNDWLLLLKRATYYSPPTPELNRLIQSTETYFTRKNQLRNAPEPQKSLLRERNRLLEPLLQERFGVFFNQYRGEILGRGRFGQDILLEIKRLQEKQTLQQRRLPFYTFCEQGGGDFAHSGLLLLPDGTLDPEKLQDCLEVAQLKRWEDPILNRRILEKSERYLRNASEQDALRAPLTDDYRWLFTDYIPNLDPGDKETFLAELGRWAQCPRSHTESTVQIQCEIPSCARDHLQLMRKLRADQTLCLRSLIDSHVLSLRGNVPLPQPFFDKFQAFYERVQDFVLRKAQGYKVDQSFEWAFDEELVQNRVQERSDGTEYLFDPCISTNSRDLFRLLKTVQSHLANLYTAVDQVNRESYLSSPLLREEVELMDAFYAIANEMLQLLGISIDFNSHKALHQKTDEIRKGRAALTQPERYVVYKRIGTQGNTEVDVMQRGDPSHLSHLDVNTDLILTHLLLKPPVEN